MRPLSLSKRQPELEWKARGEGISMARDELEKIGDGHASRGRHRKIVYVPTSTWASPVLNEPCTNITKSGPVRPREAESACLTSQRWVG